jgi:exonuclease SbcD
MCVWPVQPWSPAVRPRSTLARAHPDLLALCDEPHLDHFWAIMRFLHAADLHLDSPCSSRSETVRDRLRDASRLAFQRLVDLALSERVDAVLIAGDLFDDERLSFQTERFLLEQLHRLDERDIPVIYATGNHDPGRAGLRSVELPWPGNVTVARDRTVVRMAIKGPTHGSAQGETLGMVTAVGHETSTERDDLSTVFPGAGSGVPEVAVLHTQVIDSPGSAVHQRYAPSQLDALRASGHDYWALGHVHKRSVLSEHPGVHYPGNLQGRTHGERGAKGCLLVEVHPGTPPVVKFKKLAPIQWEDLDIQDPSEATTLDALIETIADGWHAMTGGETDVDWIARIRILGATPLWRELSWDDDQNYLRDELTYRLGLLHLTLEIGSVHSLVRADQHRARDDVLGQALRLVQDIRTGGTALAGLSSQTLIGLDAPERLQEYVEELLDTGEAEILSRMYKNVGEER